MTPFDFRQQFDRAMQDLRVAQGDVASITQAAVQAPAGALDGLMAAAQARVAAAQARIDLTLAELPAPPQAPIDDPLPPPSPAAVPDSEWDRLMREQKERDAQQVENVAALSAISRG
ncbi:MAG TPA: hypothetical protein VIE66_02600 [Methylocella sp.]|jgi:hypothetical protein